MPRKTHFRAHIRKIRDNPYRRSLYFNLLGSQGLKFSMVVKYSLFNVY